MCASLRGPVTQNASWQKGAVENANGRLRRHLPRCLDLDAPADAELQEIVLTHNLTPRMCLGFRLVPLRFTLKPPRARINFKSGARLSHRSNNGSYRATRTR
jgi:hypothetical protein